MSATLLTAGAAAIAAAVQNGSATAEKMVDASFARAGEVDAGPSGLNCILSSDAAASRSAARLATKSGALAGVPVVLKDNIATPTLFTSCGSHPRRVHQSIRGHRRTEAA